MLPPVSKIMRSVKSDLDYAWIENDKLKVKKCFNNKISCFVRAGDAELRILEGRRVKHPEGRLNSSLNFRNKLSLSLKCSDIIGLPGDYIHPKHLYNWDELIIKECNKLNIKIVHKPENTVVATIFYDAPELLSELINEKNVLWINYNAHLFNDLLKSSDFCKYYGFKNINSVSIDIPDGKGGWIFENSMDKVLEDICNKAYDLANKFDIAVIGAGAMANYACIYIRDILKKSAIDVGSILSAMRGHANRGTFRREGRSKCLVWNK